MAQLPEDEDDWDLLGEETQDGTEPTQPEVEQHKKGGRPPHDVWQHYSRGSTSEHGLLDR